MTDADQPNVDDEDQVVVITGRQARALAQTMAAVLASARADPACPAEALRAVNGLRRLLARPR
jgi:hypothetical protein